jgi:two-component system, chemotaxis family, protein-glutamate methylesterase/glutaminase
VVGASAGGVEALQTLTASLPDSLPAAVLVVIHTSPTRPSLLPAILRRFTSMPVRHAEDGDTVVPGRILVAPPDHHMVVRDGVVAVVRGPRENGHRPAVDTLFRSAARAFGPRVVGVVLSGSLDDGTAGLVAVKQRGGLAVVQDPADAVYPDMPANALAAVTADRVVPIAGLGAVVAELVGRPPGEAAPPGPLTDYETAVAMGASNGDRPGEPTVVTCPDCSGVLSSIGEGGLQRYRCRVGHGWSPASLVDARGEAVEAAMWVAIRALEEQVSLCRQLLERARRSGRHLAVGSYERRIEDATRHADVLRHTLGAWSRSDAATGDAS